MQWGLIRRRIARGMGLASHGSSSQASVGDAALVLVGGTDKRPPRGSVRGRSTRSWRGQTIHAEMTGMRKVQGPQYGSLMVKCLAAVVPIAAVFGLWSAFGHLTPGVPIAASVVMLLFAVWIRRSSVVSVDDSGVAIKMAGAIGNLLIPWDDIERLDGNRMSARLLRKSNGKRAFFAILDPHWEHRPVTLAIRSHLAP